MPFIGQQPTTGAFIQLDSLTASATANYTLQLNGANYYPESVNNLLVSINGVIQGSSTMSLNGAVLTVGATLSSSDVIDFVRVFGNVGTISTPTDGSVTANKIGTGAVTTDKIADNAVSSAKISASLGKVLQCQTVTSDSDTTLPTGVSYQIPGNSTPTISDGYTLLSKTFTPISSTSVIIAQARLYFCEPANSDTGGHATMFKDTSLIGFIGNQLFVYSLLSGSQYQTAIGDMQAVTSGHTSGTPVTFRCNVGSFSNSTSHSIRVNNGAGGSGLAYTSFAIPSSLILWEVEQ